MSEKKLCCVIAENPLLILFLGAWIGRAHV